MTSPIIKSQGRCYYLTFRPVVIECLYPGCRRTHCPSFDEKLEGLRTATRRLWKVFHMNQFKSVFFKRQKTTRHEWQPRSQSFSSLRPLRRKALGTRFHEWGAKRIDLFADTAAILISIVSKDIMGCSGQIDTYLSPGYPIIAIWNNRNQNGDRICKTFYCDKIPNKESLIFSNNS